MDLERFTVGEICGLGFAGSEGSYYMAFTVAGTVGCDMDVVCKKERQ